MPSSPRTDQRRPHRIAALSITVLVVSLIAGFATGESTHAASESAPPVVFIIDASGSMVREVSPGVTRMDVAKAATMETLESLPPDSSVGVLVFGTGTSNDDSQRAAGCTDVTTLAPIGPLNISRLEAKVDSITESGFTPIGPALRQAVTMLPSGAPGSIVLISDGVDTCSPPSSCEVASQLHRDNPLVSIHVVAFGVDDDEAAQQQMTCIGGVGGGTAVAASDPDQLASRLKAASNGAASQAALSVRGMRGIELGMNLDEVRARADGAVVGDPEIVDGVQIVSVDCGWATVELRDNRVWSITPTSAEVGTAEGVGKGAALADVESLYGAPLVSTSTAAGLENVYAAQPGTTIGYRVTFDTKTERVRTVVVCRCVPAAPDSAPRNWEVTFDGVGPLTLGMTLDQARAVAPSLRQGYTDQTWYLGEGTGREWLTVNFSTEGGIERIVLSDPETDHSGISSALPAARGIRLGESAATVVNTFPGGTYRSYLVAGSTDYLIADREGRLLTFTVLGSSALPDGSMEERYRTEQLYSVTVEDASITLSESTRASLFGG